MLVKEPGKWIFNPKEDCYECSECGHKSLSYDDVYLYDMKLSDHCESCGAEMKRSEE